MGVILTTYTHWDDPPSSQSSHFYQLSPGFTRRPRHVVGIRNARPIGHPTNVPRNAWEIESELRGRHTVDGSEIMTFVCEGFASFRESTLVPLKNIFLMHVWWMQPIFLM